MKALFAVDKRPFQVLQIKNPTQHQEEETKKPVIFFSRLASSGKDLIVNFLKNV